MVKNRIAAWAMLASMGCGQPATAPETILPQSAKSTTPTPTPTTTSVPEPNPAATTPKTEPDAGPREVEHGSSEGDADDGADGGDPHMKTHAARAYHRRLRAALRRGFLCPPRSVEEATCRPEGQVLVDDANVVVSAVLKPCGVASIDDAARKHLEGLTGKRLPTPPRPYPELQRKQWYITFDCRP